MPIPNACDIIVVGGGNAGFSAALAAKEAGAKTVLVVDKCPSVNEAGGNSYFTAGAMRTVHAGLPDLLPLVNNVDADLATKTDLDPYTADDFARDMHQVCQGDSDPELSRILVQDSNATVKWLASKGVRFQLSYNRQAFLVDGRHKFWGGLALKTQEGGKGLIDDHLRAAEAAGIQVVFSCPVIALMVSPESAAVEGVEVKYGGERVNIRAGGVILAAGGFEADPRMRAEHLGAGWERAYVRGTPYNTGDLLRIAERDGSAKRAGQWSGCHATCWDADAPPDKGDRTRSNEFTKSGYPLGVMINKQGMRFVDEGEDYRNYTYAKCGRAILKQPDGIAFQVWDSKTIPWLRMEEYRDEVVRKIHASTIEELADNCVSLGLDDPKQFVKTIDEFNQAARAHILAHPDLKWDPSVKDGLLASSNDGVAKSNWALSINEGPFLAVRVSCGVTFSFGGVAVEPETAAVISSATQKVIPGLYCAGEMLGGLFYHNYPGGSGLTAGAVFGRRAAKSAMERVAAKSSFDSEKTVRVDARQPSAGPV